MFGIISPCIKFPFYCGFCKHSCIADQEINRIDAGVEIILDDVEIPVV